MNQDLFNQCCELFETQKFGELVAICQKILDEDERDVESLLLMGKMHGQLYQPNEGLVYARKLVDIRPCDVAFELLGNLLYKAGFLDESAKAFQTILQNNPNYHQAHYGLGLIEGRAQAKVGVRVESNDDGTETEIYTALNEQLIIGCLLDTIKPKSEFVIDIGAHDGVSFSNSYDLLKRLNWKGLMIEPDRERIALMLRNYKGFTQQIDIVCGYAAPSSFHHLVKAFDIPKESGFVSIDIDSFEYELTDEVLKCISPELICIELNERIPPPVKYALLYEKNRVFGDLTTIGGCSIQLMHDLLHRHGYATIELHYNNLFAVPQKNLPLIKHLGYEDKNAEELWSDGFLNKPDRNAVYPWNKDWEHLFRLPPIDFINEFKKIIGNTENQFNFILSE